MTHWTNPYPDAVPVPLAELAACVHGLNQSCGRLDGSSFILTVDRLLEHWGQYGTKLDAYILPQPSGWYDIGVRFGNEGHQYLSPHANKERVTALLAKVRR